jgi:hypothetical protein
MKIFLFNTKEAEHQGSCYEKGIASTPLPTRAWEAKKILLSDEVLNGLKTIPAPFSVSKTTSKRQHLCVRKSNNTGGRMKLTIIIYCE